MSLIIIFTSVCFSVAFAFRNAYQRKEVGQYNAKASKGWHLWEVVIKSCFALAVATLTQTWFSKCFAVLMIISIDFFFFPLLLNLRTGQRWDYLSDKGLDRYLKKIPSILLFTLKIILLLISVTYYIK